MYVQDLNYKNIQHILSLSTVNTYSYFFRNCIVNGRKCTQMVRNAPKYEFRVQWSGSSEFVAKNSDATSWHELLH